MFNVFVGEIWFYLQLKAEVNFLKKMLLYDMREDIMFILIYICKK